MSEILEDKDHVIVKPGRNIMATMANEFKSEINSVIRELPRDVTIDLTSVEMIDSSGIEVIISIYDFLKKNGKKIRVTNAAKDIYDFFSFLRLDRHFIVEKAQ